jgi:hypothetical protein
MKIGVDVWGLVASGLHAAARLTAPTSLPQRYEEELDAMD